MQRIMHMQQTSKTRFVNAFVQAFSSVFRIQRVETDEQAVQVLDWAVLDTHGWIDSPVYNSAGYQMTVYNLASKMFVYSIVFTDLGDGRFDSAAYAVTPNDTRFLEAIQIGNYD
jgi:hypothetical protein